MARLGLSQTGLFFISFRSLLVPIVQSPSFILPRDAGEEQRWGLEPLERLERLERFERGYRRWVTKDSPAVSYDKALNGLRSHQPTDDGNVKITSEIVRNVAGVLAKLVNCRVNKCGISVAVFFHSKGQRCQE